MALRLTLASKNFKGIVFEIIVKNKSGIIKILSENGHFWGFWGIFYVDRYIYIRKGSFMCSVVIYYAWGNKNDILEGE